MNNSSSLQSRGLAVLRVILGVVFLMHGGQKLFIWGFHGVAGFLGGLGIPFPAFSGVVLTVVELLGGAALVLGLLTRWAALLLAVDMLVAILTFHLKHGFFNHNQGYEYNLTLALVALSFAINGAGPVSVDAALRLQDTGPVWGLAALLAALGGAAVQLANRRQPVAQESS